jgi:hypothetical protein
MQQLPDILEAVREGELSDEDAVAQAPDFATPLTRYGPIIRSALIWFLCSCCRPAASEMLAKRLDPAGCQQRHAWLRRSW